MVNYFVLWFLHCFLFACLVVVVFLFMFISLHIVAIVLHLFVQDTLVPFPKFIYIHKTFTISLFVSFFFYTISLESFYSFLFKNCWFLVLSWLLCSFLVFLIFFSCFVFEHPFPLLCYRKEETWWWFKFIFICSFNQCDLSLNQNLFVNDFILF